MRHPRMAGSFRVLVESFPLYPRSPRVSSKPCCPGTSSRLLPLQLVVVSSLLPPAFPGYIPSVLTRQVGAAAQFHSNAHQHNELPKSPFQTFVDVFKDELRKNLEFAENVKQLQGDVDKFQDSEAMKKAKDAYEHARVCLYPPTHCFLIRCH